MSAADRRGHGHRPRQKSSKKPRPPKQNRHRRCRHGTSGLLRGARLHFVRSRGRTAPRLPPRSPSVINKTGSRAQPSPRSLHHLLGRPRSGEQRSRAVPCPLRSNLQRGPITVCAARARRFAPPSARPVTPPPTAPAPCTHATTLFVFKQMKGTDSDDHLRAVYRSRWMGGGPSILVHHAPRSKRLGGMVPTLTVPRRRAVGPRRQRPACGRDPNAARRSDSGQSRSWRPRISSQALSQRGQSGPFWSKKALGATQCSAWSVLDRPCLRIGRVLGPRVTLHPACVAHLGRRDDVVERRVISEGLLDEGVLDRPRTVHHIQPP